MPESLRVGEAQVNFWATRYLNAKPMREGRGWLEVQTTDAVLRVGLKRRRWID